MTWIDYKKACGMNPQSSMIKLPQNIQNITWSHKLYQENHENLETEIWQQEEESLAKAKIQRGIFQEDAQAPLQFIIAMMSLNHVLRKYAARCKISRSQEKIDHLMYMDDIKLYAKNEKEMETLIHTGKYTVKI